MGEIYLHSSQNVKVISIGVRIDTMTDTHNNLAGLVKRRKADGFPEPHFNSHSIIKK